MQRRKHHTQSQRTSRYQPSTMTSKDYIGNAIFNHKLEQVLRVLTCLGYNAKVPMNISAVGYNILCTMNSGNDLEMFQIAVSDIDGWKFTPTQNSYLIRLGIKPKVLLLALCNARVNGVMATIAQGTKVLTPYCVLLETARLALTDYETLVKEYEDYKNVLLRDVAEDDILA